MPQETYRTIQSLMANQSVIDLTRGLALVKEQAAAADPSEYEALCEIILPVFYIDTFDHPEYAPVLDEAVAIVAGFGQRVIPFLIDNMEAGDIKAQMAIAQTLGHMGAPAIDSLVTQYDSGCGDPACRAFLLYAMGKIKSPQVIRVAPLLIQAADSGDLELRDTATRAIGKCVESIASADLTDELRTSFWVVLCRRLTESSPGIRAKAVRSLGKLAKYGHLTETQRGELKTRIKRILGEDADFEWDRAYVVRKEAKEASAYV
jgi:hypothetical protein